MPYPVYTGDEAHEKVNYLLAEVERGKSRYQFRNPDNLCCGYFFGETCWVAFDNRDHNCWAEEFRTEKRCLKYLGINKP